LRRARPRRDPIDLPISMARPSFSSILTHLIEEPYYTEQRSAQRDTEESGDGPLGEFMSPIASIASVFSGAGHVCVRLP